MRKKMTGAQMMAHLDACEAEQGPRRHYKKRKRKLEKYRTEIMEMHNLGGNYTQIQRAARTLFVPKVHVHLSTVKRFIDANNAQDKNVFE